MPNRDLFATEYPFESRYLEIGGHHYHYVDQGSGDPLLFVHGNPTWSFAWRHFIQKLSRDYRCIAVDHIGCGLSDQPPATPAGNPGSSSPGFGYTLAEHMANLRTLIERLDLRRITLVGHDWGGCIGMGVAGQIPDRFGRLILCNTAAFRSQRIPSRIAVCRIPVLGKLAVQGLNAFARAALVMAVEKPLSPAVKRGYLAPYDSWSQRIATLEFVRDIPLKPSHRSYETLVAVESNLSRLLEHPMLLVWGERDWCFTPVFLEEFQRRFPEAETTRFADAGHYVFEDARDAMLARMQLFLEDRPM